MCILLNLSSFESVLLSSLVMIDYTRIYGTDCKLYTYDYFHGCINDMIKGYIDLFNKQNKVN